MAKLVPCLRATDTYTETNFLFLHSLPGTEATRRVTLEHFCRSFDTDDTSGWSCQTIIDGEAMSHDDAVFIAQNYASEHDIPVIYESHAD